MEETPCPQLRLPQNLLIRSQISSLPLLEPYPQDDLRLQFDLRSPNLLSPAFQIPKSPLSKSRFAIAITSRSSPTPPSARRGPEPQSPLRRSRRHRTAQTRSDFSPDSPRHRPRATRRDLLLHLFEFEALGCMLFSTEQVHEEVEMMRKAGLIQGGSLENAMVCSATTSWLNPPLHFDDEPCRHKLLDLVGDFSLFVQNGNQGLPLAHIIAYKSSGDSGANVKRLEQETESKILQLKEQSSRVSRDVGDMLLRQVTTVKN